MPSPRLHLDLETYSDLDLNAAGGYAYAAHPSTEILMAAYALEDDDDVSVAIGHDEVLDALSRWIDDPNITKVAHNSQFDRTVLAEAYGRHLDVEQWDDTMPRAAEHGHPQKLEQLAVALGGEQKDTAGTRLINLFSKPYRGSRLRPEDRIDDWMDFVEYCRQDVVTLRDVDRRLPDWPTENERRLWLADQRINDRGINFDHRTARAAVGAAEANQEKQRTEIQLLLGVDNPNSTKQLLAGLAEAGADLPDLKAETVKGRLVTGDGLTPVTRRSLELRLELALASSKKFQTGLDRMSPDHRLRGAFKFFGAHTGRWAGRGLQPQNLPRAEFETEVETEETIDRLLDTGEATPQELKALVRSTFLGPLTVVDFAAIEARVIAWLAGEQWALDAFYAGRDIYVETAERMSTPGNKLDRSQGKVAVLALGYNGAVGSLRAMGATGSDKDLATQVTQWRSANPRIVDLWAELDEAFEYGGTVGSRLEVVKDEDSRHLLLPSGRAISYRRFKMRRLRKKGWDSPRMVMTFADPTRRFPYLDTYGGRLSENATQAVARDILGAALVRMDAAGLPVVGHVHDEVLVEGERLDEVKALMTEPPDWADGLPLGAAGFVCRRYRKDEDESGKASTSE